MAIAWETTYEVAVAKARETKRLVMAEFFSPY